MVNGVFYRRNHASSDPVPETDRHAIDRLIDQGRGVRRSIDSFASDSRQVEGGGYYQQGWVSIYLWPEPSGVLQPTISELSSESLNQLRARSAVETPLLDSRVTTYYFDQVQTTTNSFIMRRYLGASMNRGQKYVAVELFIDGRAKLHLPIEHMAWESQPMDSHGFRSAAARGALIYQRQVLGGYSDETPDFFDIHRLWRDTQVTLGFVSNWVGTGVADVIVRCALELSYVANAIAFDDSDAWAGHVEKHGLPSVASENVRIPEPGQPGLVLPWSDDGADWRFVCGLIGLAFGFPSDSYEPMLDEIGAR